MTPAIPAVSTSTSAPEAITADVLVVPVRPGAKKPEIPAEAGLGSSAAKALAKAAVAVGQTGKLESVSRVPAPKGVSAASVVLVGLGDADSADALESVRRAAGAALRTLSGADTVALAFPAATAVDVEAAVLGAILGAYRYSSYKTAADAQKRTAKIVVAAKRKAAAGAARAEAIAAAVAGARDLINQPPLDLYPETFAAQITAQTKGTKVSATVYDEKRLRAEGFGGLIGVGQGSTRGPRLVKLTYSPKRAARHLSIVGKGITFDSGGLSLKPAAGMDDMKSDMSGAAAASQVVFAAAALKLDVKVTAWLALAENMPGSSAQRPSDVLRIYGGKTVEVTNTDAEGRLVLADAMVAAQEEKPDVLIDVATLTGAQVVALGLRTSGVMGTDSAREDVAAAAGAAGEQIWPMPIPEEMLAQFDSKTADLTNSGTRAGGMLAAAAFLREFVAEGQEWAHIDIAGPANNTEKPWGYTVAGGTGVPVRTLVELAERMAG